MAASGEGNTSRRDLLLEIQNARQKEWESKKAFEVDVPADGKCVNGKFFGNFPYPYMNGLLHLGHAFSLSKLEFSAAFERLRGKHVLFPQAFHCTGMPIKACADKLDREIEKYGNPPQFPKEEAEAAPKAEEEKEVKDPSKFKGKKSKATAKSGTASYQWQILEMSGIPTEEIGQFRDAHHWLQYFPGKAIDHLKQLGCGVDWRRSFITTDVNPYYDRFIGWQFRKLYAQGRVIKDKRYAVYSPLDGQPCADHDRSSGEGVLPQEYTLIKMKALDLTGALAPLAGKGRVFFVAGTLRPETMYGQTNFWLLPNGEYGAYRGLNDEIYIMAERSALNMSYQELTPVRGEPECLLKVKGQDLIGAPVKSPNCAHERIYGLPLLTIKMGKGTGVVTSVPSDAPDDYIALRDLKENKDKLKDKHGVKDEWVMPFDVIPIIEIEGFGNMAAVSVSKELKIKSQHDAAKLALAKEKTYLKGFTHGVMIVGEYAGKKVSEVKPIIKNAMVASGEAILYNEPESKVMSRSGDECVVALTDQWYITYGEEEWAKLTKECLDEMDTHGSEARANFEHTLGWLEKWAVSRAYGLGTRVPWDPEYLVESLSDSTIYMAYYTIAHFLQNGDMYGKDTSLVNPEDLTDEVWDYVFCDGALPAETKIPIEKLEAMHREFEYWYPFDIRVSGKDLIQNHLTFCLYNHTAIWPDKSKWPKAFRTNGHIMLNAAKMSKQTGNFLTLEQGIAKYSSDAIRVALADAGDGMDDANFEETSANAAILRLTKEIAWVEESIANVGSLDQGPVSTFFERVFENEINIAVHRTKAAFERMMFREALKTGWYDLMNARDTYRFSCKEKMLNRHLVERYIEVSTLLLMPFAPHTMDHIWVNMLKKGSSGLTAGWPEAPQPDYGLQHAATFIEEFVSALRNSKRKKEAPGKAKKGVAPPPAKTFTKVTIRVAPCFISWQAATLEALSSKFDPESRTFPEDVFKTVLSEVATNPAASQWSEKDLKKMIMPFAKYRKEKAIEGGAGALGVTPPFDEKELLSELSGYITASVGLDSIEIGDYENQEAGPGGKIDVYPGNPQMEFS
ncbi:hypothetical protein BSKO_06047 [Bryopsis sp. KO-2023]|nr:hypothetical protein BSKO_06047 [Bryopsis sp. KO-2023]